MPIWLEQSEVDAAAAQGAEPLAQLIDRDPLLAIRIFHHCRHLNAASLPTTILQAVQALGPNQVRQFCADLPRLDPSNGHHQHLLQAVGDALLATSLLRSWFELRNIPWHDDDYWLVVMDASALWCLWWLEPQVMQGFELQLEQQGKPLFKNASEYLNCRYLEAITGLMNLWRLPIALNLSRPQAEGGQSEYKKQALKFFLRFSHELAQACRYDWQSSHFQTLCRRGSMALSLDNFQDRLHQWLKQAQKQQQHMPWVATALNQQLGSLNCPQPKVTKVTDSESKGHSWAQPAPARAPRPAQDKAASAALAQMMQQGTLNQVPLPAATPPPEPTSQFQPKRIYLDVKAAMLKPSPPFSTLLDLEYSLLQACLLGLEMGAVVLWKKSSQHPHYELVSWRGEYEPAAKLPLAESAILMQFCRQPVSLWLDEQNRQRIEAQLPNALVQAGQHRQQLFRSIPVQNKHFYLLHGLSLANAALTTTHYQLFRELAAAFGRAAHKLTSPS